MERPPDLVIREARSNPPAHAASAPTLLSWLRDEDYGSRGFSVLDPEGNIWSFGTYHGE